MMPPIRVLLAKPGLDGHDRGARVVALALRQAGFEVIYSGLHQTVDQIVRDALQEDVDVVGLSILSGAHRPILERVMARLRSERLNPVVLVGGHIPAQDVEPLRELGVDGVFPTGSSLEAIAEYIRERVAQRRAAEIAEIRRPP